MAPVTPYTRNLGDREPIAAMRDSASRLRSLIAGWPPEQFEKSYAPGKWTARQILTHLAQSELALGTRARLVLATPNYVSQAFDPDQWMARESTLTARDAVDALLAISRMNVAFFEQLSRKDRDTPFSHPEYGTITVDWIIHQMAGHQIHHLEQLEAMATA